MMFTKLKYCGFVFLVFTTVLFALGERPETKSSSTVRPEAIHSPDTQFSKAFSEYQDAKKTRYAEYANQATVDFEKYLKTYPDDRNVLNAFFLISDAYYLAGKLSKQEEYLKKYLDYVVSNNVTTNYFYKEARLKNAEVVYRQGDAPQAKVICESLLSEYASDENFKYDINKQLLVIYESLNTTDKLIPQYQYFIERKNKLENADLYYVYAYKLAVIYFNNKQFAKARPYFKEIAAKKDSASLKYFVESSKSYLNKIDGVPAGLKTKK